MSRGSPTLSSKAAVVMKPSSLRLSRNTPNFLPPFVSCNTLEAYTLEQKQQKQRMFMTNINEQLQKKAAQTQQLLQQKKLEQDRQKADNEYLTSVQLAEKQSKKQRSQEYRKVLDQQSGKAAQDLYQANLDRFYGCESTKPSQGFSEARQRFFGVESGDMNRSTGSIRFAKTIPRTVVTDPITGAVKHFEVSRGKIYSLGNSKGSAVAGKISESPPPKREEGVYFGKKVERKVIFNPLTGMRSVFGKKQVDTLSKSFEGHNSTPFLPHMLSSVLK